MSGDVRLLAWRAGCLAVVRFVTEYTAKPMRHRRSGSTNLAPEALRTLGSVLEDEQVTKSGDYRYSSSMLKSCHHIRCLCSFSYQTPIRLPVVVISSSRGLKPQSHHSHLSRYSRETRPVFMHSSHSSFIYRYTSCMKSFQR